MNEKLQQFARSELKKGLAQLPLGWQQKFCLLYANKHAPVDEVVDNLPESKLDWAMQQVENSLRKLSREKPNCT